MVELDPSGGSLDCWLRATGEPGLIRAASVLRRQAQGCESRMSKASPTSCSTCPPAPAELSRARYAQRSSRPTRSSSYPGTPWLARLGRVGRATRTARTAAATTIWSVKAPATRASVTPAHSRCAARHGSSAVPALRNRGLRMAKVRSPRLGSRGWIEFALARNSVNNDGCGPSQGGHRSRSTVSSNLLRK